MHIVEGPYPVDGDWTLEPVGNGTRVRFLAEGELRGATRMLQPIVRRLLARQMAGYHQNLKHNVESSEARFEQR